MCTCCLCLCVTDTVFIGKVFCRSYCWRRLWVEDGHMRGVEDGHAWGRWVAGPAVTCGSRFGTRSPRRRTYGGRGGRGRESRPRAGPRRAGPGPREGGIPSDFPSLSYLSYSRPGAAGSVGSPSAGRLVAGSSRAPCSLRPCPMLHAACCVDPFIPCAPV
jgi:hypothetical protein